MFGRVFAIALNTYRESVRARILVGLAGVAFAISLGSLVVGAWTLKNAPRVASDLGTASMSLFSVAVAILIGATSLHRELEDKTVFPILARPIRRGEYLVGKYLGTLLTLGVFILADTGLILLMGGALAGRSLVLIVGVFFGGLAALVAPSIRSTNARTFGPIPWSVFMLLAGIALSGGAPDERRLVLGSGLLCFCEVTILVGVVTLFASFSTPFLSGLLAVLVWLVGRSADTLARLKPHYVGQFVHDVGVVLASLWPNLQNYVPPRPLLTGEVDVNLTAYFAKAALMAVAWAVGLLATASFIFKRRDFL